MAREPKAHELVSPVDISDDPLDSEWPLAWTGVTIVIATLALLFANAGALSGWIDERDPSDLQQRASDLANDWTARMETLGVATPRAELHALWKKAQALRFGTEAPGPTQ